MYYFALTSGVEPSSSCLAHEEKGEGLHFGFELLPGEPLHQGPEPS
jgi:hypothetical protein